MKMTNEEWIKKFEDVDVSNLVGATKTDNAARTLVSLVYKLVREQRKYSLQDFIRDIYLAEDLTSELWSIIDQNGDWRDIIWFLGDADTDRSIFIHGDDGRLYPMNPQIVKELKEKIIGRLKKEEKDHHDR